MVQKNLQEAHNQDSGAAFLFGIWIPSHSREKRNVKANLAKGSFYQTSLAQRHGGNVEYVQCISPSSADHRRPVFSFGKVNLRSKLRLQQGQVAADWLVLGKKL